MPISSISKSYLPLSGYSITSSPQGDNSLIIYPSTMAGLAALHSTFPVFPGCLPSHRDVTLGDLQPPGKDWQPSGSVGMLSSSTRDLSMGKSPSYPWDVPPTVSAILVKRVWGDGVAGPPVPPHRAATELKFKLDQDLLRRSTAALPT